MRSRLGLAACGAVLALAPAFVLADEDEDEYEFFDRTPQDCITVARIRNTEIVDDRTILFYLRGGKVYRNNLARSCSDLKAADLFSYEIRSGRLCDVNTIQVLRRFGLGFDTTMTCRLGEFHPLTPEEAELMELEPNELAQRLNRVVVQPIELPPDGAGVGDAAVDPGQSAAGDVGAADDVLSDGEGAAADL